MPGSSRLAVPWPRRGTAAAAAATSRTATRGPSGSSSCSPTRTSSPTTAPPTGSGMACPRSPPPTPTQFTRFRDWLGTSSGFESAQFRELEAVLGRRDRKMLSAPALTDTERERITAAMSRPSLFDSFVRYLAGEGYDVPAEILRRD